MSEPIYFSIYSLLQEYLYGADTVLTADMELVLTFVSTTLSGLVLVLPFVVVFVILRAVFGK